MARHRRNGGGGRGLHIMQGGGSEKGAVILGIAAFVAMIVIYAAKSRFNL